MNFLKRTFLMFMIFIFIFSSNFYKNSNSQEKVLTQIGVIGVMPDDYIGAFTLLWANTVEDDFRSEYSFPMQGMKFKNGYLYVLDTSYGRVHILNKNLKHIRVIGELGLGDGKLQYPADIDVDENGNIYVVDFFNNYIVKFSPFGEVLLQFGEEGSEEGKFNGPSGIAVSKDGKIYVSDQLNSRIQIFTNEGSFIKSIIYDDITNPQGMCVDEENNLWVVDAKNCKIFKLDQNGKILFSFGSKGGADNQFLYPFDIEVKGNFIYVVDRGLGATINPGIKKFDKYGNFVSKIGRRGTRVPLQNGEFLTPAGVAIDDEENIYTFDAGFFVQYGNPFGWPRTTRLTVFDKNGNFKNKIDYDPGVDGRLINPISVSVDNLGNIWVAHWAEFGDTGEVVIFNSEGKFIKKITGISEDKPFAAIGGVLCWKNEVFISSGIEDAPITVFDLQGNFLRVLDKCKRDIYNPYQITVDNKGRLWVVTRNFIIYAISPSDGTILKEIEIMSEASSIAVDINNNLYLATFDHYIDVYDENGKFLKRMGKGGGREIEKFWYPSGITIDKEGIIYVADTENGRIQMYKSDGTFLGSTPRGYYQLAHLYMSHDGLIYAADLFHNVVRVISPFGEKIQDYAFSIIVDEIEKITKPGSETFFNITIFNRGAKQDTYEINLVSNLNNWNISYPREITVNSNDKKSFITKVIPPASAKVGEEIKIEMEIKSKGNPSIKKNISFKVIIATKTKIIIGDYQVDLDKSFEIPVIIKDAENLYGFGFTLKYDTEYLEIEDIIEGDFLKKDGVTTLFLKNINKEKGEILVGVSRTGKVQGISGDGVLIKFKFRAIKLGKVELKVTNFVLKNPELNDLSANFEFGTINIIKTQKIILKLQIGNKIMLINNIKKEIDVPPLIIEGRTLLPIRHIAEPLGATVGWDPNEKKVTVSLKNTVIELWIGKNIARVNGVNTLIDPNNPKVVPMVIQGRTMLPVRFVAENLGCEVNWDQETKTVTILYPRD